MDELNGYLAGVGIMGAFLCATSAYTNFLAYRATRDMILKGEIKTIRDDLKNSEHEHVFINMFSRPGMHLALMIYGK
jgi:lipid-binding SYLF domain-containing protein